MIFNQFLREIVQIRIDNETTGVLYYINDRHFQGSRSELRGSHHPQADVV